MIYKALIFLEKELHDYFETNYERDVAMTYVVSQDGNTDPQNDNSVLLTLISIEEEKALKSQSPYVKGVNGSSIKVNPEIKLNLQILFTANFKDYKEAIKSLSGVLRFFQGRNVFDHQNSPALDPGIDKLILELITPSFEQLNHMWGYLGAKYMPSVMYKVRMLTIQESKALESVEGVAGINKDFSAS